MKGGRTPIHIMRWAPADFENDEAVRLAVRRRNYCALAFYMAFINHSFMAGGDLPEDLERVSATLGWHLHDVRAAVSYWVSEGKLEVVNGRLIQRRVSREIAKELEFRELQAERGRLGGRPRKAVANPPLLEAKSPPAPAPAPAPAPIERQPAGPPNPLIQGRRVDLEHEAYRLIREHAVIEPERDQTDILLEATSWQTRDGHTRSKVRVETLSDDHLIRTLRDLRANLEMARRERGTKATAAS